MINNFKGEHLYQDLLFMEYRNSPAEEVELKIVLVVDLLEMNNV